jgi:putative ABC transport system permease protein
MGIILLSLILLTWIFPQISEIGVMKALGASTKHVFAGFTMVLCLIVFIGLMAGLPLGYRTASLYSEFVAYLQNFEVVTSLLPIYTHVMVVAVCFVIPLLFGIFSLIESSNITVNQSINRTFHTPHKGLLRLSQTLNSSRLKYGINNLLRHSQRTILTVLLIAVGVGLYFTASNVAYSIKTDLEQFAQSARYEIGVLLPDSIQRAEAAFLNKLPFVESIAPLNTSRVTYTPPRAAFSEISIVRILSSEVVIDNNRLQRGAIDRNCQDCIYASGEDMRKGFEEVKLGTPVELTFPSGESRTYTFSGVIRDLVAINAPFFIFDDEMTQSFNSLALELKSGLSDKEIFDASNAVDDAFLEQGINLRNRTSVKMRMLSILNHLDPTFMVIKILGITTVILGLLGLLIVLNLTLQERTREIGVMKSIGASFGKISNLFKQEFLLMSLLSILLGGLMSIPLAKALINLIAETIIRHPVPFRNDFSTVAFSTLIILVIQVILISIYNQLKIGKNARELMDHNF